MGVRGWGGGGMGLIACDEVHRCADAADDDLQRVTRDA
jgi:hypothetical protein